MARKNKRSQVRKPQRGQSGSARPARPVGLPPPSAPPAGETPSAATPPAPPAAARMVQRPLPRARGRQIGGPLPAEDATIPLERVPYFTADIRRIAVTAAFMLVLLIAGSIILRGMLQA